MSEFNFDVIKPKQTPQKTLQTVAEEIFDSWDQDMLDKKFRTKCTHSLSQSLPENIATSEKEYEKILEPHND